MKNNLQYEAFGELLVRLRQTAGFAQQVDLANRLKTSQQTVSRWELGTSRPRDKQMPLIASVLGASLDELLAAAGYVSKKPITTVLSFDQPFPLNSLTPDSFERFCWFFLARLYPAAKTHRAGGQGHTQEGLDIDVQFSDGTAHTFQCKRIKEFGPQKVKDAITAHTRSAAKKFILLSRVASPQAREVVNELADWDIWDKEDISRLIRQKLSKQEQILLVDTYFAGQRLALLGEAEAGPWQSAEVFFAPFKSRLGAFSHDWDIVGREEDVQAIVTCLAERSVPMIFLVGAGGIGKSRILKQVVDVYKSDHADSKVYFLSPTDEPTNKSFENLGRGKKVLVIDDAHDRNDLPLLFQYVANPEHQAILLMALRHYGLDYIKDKASGFALSGDRIFEHKIEPLTLEQATRLAAKILEVFGGTVAAAPDIARLTLDCTLATVMGAQIVAKENIHVEFVKNEDAFRDTFLGRFRKVIAGEIGDNRDAESIIQLLNILALIQPFYPEDAAVAKLALAVEKLDVVVTNRLIPLLAKAGVLFKRGGQYRLAPDLLADFIVEKICIGDNGISTGYAERVFDAANNTQMEHLLLNLGKLDWRRANGDPSNSLLLDGVWAKLTPTSDYSDPHIGAVTAVAFYQPERTLAFAEHLIREGRCLDTLPEMIKYAGYSFEHLPRACECLWELGKRDNRPLSQHPGHAICILAQLCSVELGKPQKYNETVVEFALGLLDQYDAWEQAYSPLDVLEGILLTERHTMSMDGRSFKINTFGIPVDFVAELREKVINAVINLLSNGNVKIAVKAAKFLSNGLRYPHGISGQLIPPGVIEAWTTVFAKTLENIEQATLAKQLDELVLIELCETVSWHADFADGVTMPLAKKIQESIPSSLDFRTIFALVNGNKPVFKAGEDCEEAMAMFGRKLDGLTEELISTYLDGEKLRARIDEDLCAIVENNAEQNGAALYQRLLDKSESLAKATVIHALAKPNAQTTQFAGIALAKLFERDWAKGVEFATRFLKTNENELWIAVGRAYADFDLASAQYKEDDLVLLRTILSSNEQWVVLNAIAALRRVAKRDHSLAIDLLKCIDLSISKKVADDVMFLFQGDKTIPYGALSEKDIQCFLDKLKLLKTLDGYWTSVFIAQVSKLHPVMTANFFMARVEHAAAIEDWGYRPCNQEARERPGLLFRESKKFGFVLRQIANWVRLKLDANYRFMHHAAELFNAMFSPFDSEILGFLQDWADKSTLGEIKFLSEIFGEVPPNFVFEHSAFVLRFLKSVEPYGKEAADSANSAFYRSAISGLRGGTPGQPFPRDLKMKEAAEKAKQNLSRFAPGYTLYDNIQKHAEKNIQRSLKEREAFED